jgi:hypothetical protein
VPSGSFKTMFDNLALACRHMLDGPHGVLIRPDQGLSVLYGEPPATTDLAIVNFQSDACDRPLFDPMGRPWPQHLCHADEAEDPFPFGAQARRVFAAHGLTSTLCERTLAINAIYPNAPIGDSGLWLGAEGGYGAWRRFSIGWTSLVLEQVRPKAILLLGQNAKLAIGRKLADMPVVEAVPFAATAEEGSDAIYDAPFRRLKKLLGLRPPGASATHPFESPELNEIYGYWLAKRGQRRMPSRRDLDPTEIPRLLRNLMLIDVGRDPFRFGYRLIGTNVVDATGENRTGKDFDVVGFIAANPIVRQEYITVATTGEPLHSFEPFYRLDTRREYDVERLLLPLSSDGVTVDMILVYFHFKAGTYSAH